MYEQQIRAGAALLDKTRPGWRDQVAVADLQMEQCSQCVVGHVWGLTMVEPDKAHYGYRRALREMLAIEVEEIEESGEDRDLLRERGLDYYLIEWQAEHGFSIGDDEFDDELDNPSEGYWDTLRDEWIGFIKGEWS